MSEGTYRRPDPRQFGFCGGQTARACNCVGPKNGQPKCPCLMQNLRVLDGRWVEVIDHGPVKVIDNIDRAKLGWFEAFGNI